MPKNEKEIRYLNIDNINEFLKVEKREDTQEEKMVLEGYPIVFNQETLIGSEEWGWIESIDPRALDNADMSDTPLKYNHQDVTPILARVRNGSLVLTKDTYGLHMRAELLDTQSNKDFYKMVRAGLLDKMSFAFNVTDEEIDYNSKPMKRKITGIGRLYDVSIVDVPAYEQTSLLARSKEMAEAKSLLDAEAEKRALEEAEASNKLEEERKQKEAFEFRKKKEIAKLRIGGNWND